MAVSGKDRVPPHNDDAERAVIGASLLDENAIYISQQHLQPDDFYSPRHRKIFEAIISLSNRGIRPDLLTLNDELERMGKLDESGGTDYIASLTHAVPSSANVEYYSQIVQEASLRRGLITVSGESGAKAYDETKEPKIILEETQQKLFLMSDPKRSLEYKKVQNIISPVVKHIHHIYQTKPPHTGIVSGFPDLDKLTSGFQPSELVIIGARPGMGKTAIALCMAANISIRQKKPAAFFSLEMSDQALMIRLLSSETKIDSYHIRTGHFTSSQFDKILSIGDQIHVSPLYIIDNPHMTMLNIQTMSRRLRLLEKIEIIFIDYIGLISSENTMAPRWELIGQVSRSLKGLARELNIPIVALSQLRREAEKEKPSLADIRESGSIEQDADLVMFLNRDRELEKPPDEKKKEDPQPVQLTLAKNRNGPTGLVGLDFYSHLTRFESKKKEN